MHDYKLKASLKITLLRVTYDARTPESAALIKPPDLSGDHA